MKNHFGAVFYQLKEYIVILVLTNMAVDTKTIKMHAKNCNDVEVAYMCVAKHEVGGIIVRIFMLYIL